MVYFTFSMLIFPVEFPEPTHWTMHQRLSGKEVVSRGNVRPFGKGASGFAQRLAWFQFQMMDL